MLMLMSLSVVMKYWQKGERWFLYTYVVLEEVIARMSLVTIVYGLQLSGLSQTELYYF